MSNKESQPDLSFEDALKQLEGIVDSLESGEVPLQEMVEKYELGTSLLKLCRSRLDEAELRIQKVEKSENGLSTELLELE